MDDRFRNYVRFYVGLSVRLLRRIGVDHAHSITNSDETTLHYFVLSRGYGHRTANFLRLWSFDSTTARELGTDLVGLLQTLLEMAFCRCFQSLPSQVLTKVFGPGLYSDMGLNSLSPLLQYSSLSSLERSSWMDMYNGSQDLDIRAFPAQRRRQKAEQRDRHREIASLLKQDYHRIILQLACDEEMEPSSMPNLKLPDPERNNEEMLEQIRHYSSNCTL